MLKYLKGPLLTSFLLFSSLTCSARVFDITKERFATYLRGSAATSTLGLGLFDQSSGTGTTFTDSGATYGFSGEIGILLGFSDIVLRLGFEFLRPKTVEAITGKDPAGNELFTLTSDILGTSPLVGAEYGYYVSPTFRGFVGGSAGYTTINFGNHYTLTAAGQAVTGGGNFDVEGSGTAISGTFTTGLETLLSDNVTFLIEAGYRYLRVENLVHKVSAPFTFTGAIQPGNPVVNGNGEKQIVDLSGPIGAIALRFYIDIL